MDFTGLLVFAAAYLVGVATPGPGIAAIVARVLGRGLTGAAAFIAGFAVGDLVWFTVAATGLAVIASTFATLFLVIKYAGAVYLLYLAWRLWTAPTDPVDAPDATARESRPGLFLAGLAIQLGNPKAIIFFLALLPTVVDLEALTVAGFLEIAATIAVLLSLVMGGYALAAARARRLLKSPQALRLVNRGTGTVMAGAAVAIVSR